MANKLYIGNLSYQLKEDELRAVFAEVGNVVSVTIIKDRVSGQSRGFGFVEMATEDDAKNAIATLKGRPVNIGPLVVRDPGPHPPLHTRGGRRAGGYGGGPR